LDCQSKCHPSSNIFSTLTKEQFIALTTFRKTGAGVMTPVWFANDGENRLVIFTGRSSGEVKRLRNNPRVQLAPSDAQGKLRGATIQVQARFIEGGTATRALELLKHKYGFQFTLVEWMNKLRGGSPTTRVFIEIVPVG
jgi:PPOX class probable F420-dependent enzyme